MRAPIDWEEAKSAYAAHHEDACDCEYHSSDQEMEEQIHMDMHLDALEPEDTVEEHHEEHMGLEVVE